MAYRITEEVQSYLDGCVEELHALLEQLCLIPAPSHFEDQRAAFVKAWLEKAGAKGVYIDEAKNVVFPFNCEGRNDITCFEAHLDTVFPMETPLKFVRDEENFYCPGVGDDTACLAVMMMVIKYAVQNHIRPKGGVLFVANACEEGLGNLKGTRQIFQDFEGRISRFYTFDGTYRAVTCRSVGSHRYSIEVETQGGHSWVNFGNKNAIAALAQLIGALSAIKVPEKENTKTTFNFGTVEGGTSVNTIAQNASMLYEYRSNDPECLAYMQKSFEDVIEKAKEQEGVRIRVTTVGIRPCGEAKDKEIHEEMIRRSVEISKKHSGINCVTSSGSTDCNIPLSLGIPAVCPGLYLGGGMHTREEWLNIKSLEVGLKIATETIFDYFEI